CYVHHRDLHSFPTRRSSDLQGHLTERTYWLIVARNQATAEVKYFVSNAPADTPLEKLLRVAFRRWNVEHTLRVSKSEIGFGHFEDRKSTRLNSSHLGISYAV